MVESRRNPSRVCIAGGRSMRMDCRRLSWMRSRRRRLRCIGWCYDARVEGEVYESGPPRNSGPAESSNAGGVAEFFYRAAVRGDGQEVCNAGLPVWVPKVWGNFG